MTETMCERCNEMPARFYNEDHYQAVCEGCHAFYDKHNCAGDHCYCIGGDENFDAHQNDAEIEPIHPDYDYDAAGADGDALASAGWGTDEDYGYFGGED